MAKRFQQPGRGQPLIVFTNCLLMCFHSLSRLNKAKHSDGITAVAFGFSFGPRVFFIVICLQFWRVCRRVPSAGCAVRIRLSGTRHWPCPGVLLAFCNRSGSVSGCVTQQAPYISGGLLLIRIVQSSYQPRQITSHSSRRFASVRFSQAPCRRGLIQSLRCNSRPLLNFTAENLTAAFVFGVAAVLFKPDGQADLIAVAQY